MPRPQQEPLRPLTTEERAALQVIAHSSSAPAALVDRARALLAVAAGHSYSAAAQRAGRKSWNTVSGWVARFNRDGLAALTPRHGGGTPVQYGAAEQARILREFQRTPDLARDGTATWSLTTLQRALQIAPDGLPAVSTWTIFRTLHAAGYTWQQSRTWCPTGQVLRKRKGQLEKVTDPEAATKKG